MHLYYNVNFGEFWFYLIQPASSKPPEQRCMCSIEQAPHLPARRIYEAGNHF